MKIVILKQNLKNALSVSERGVKDDLNLPILKNILLKADSTLNLATTNLEIGIKNQTPAKILESGSITVPFSPFFNIISNTDSERIQLETDKNTLIIKTDNYTANLQGTPEEDFPIIPKPENKEEYFEISAVSLSEAIGQVSFACQVSDIKPEISGVLFNFQTGVIKLAATDSFRLAERTILNTEFKTNYKKGVKAIIPLITIQEVLKAFSQEDQVRIFIDSHQISFQTEKTQIISRLIDGEYPDYNQIIPKETKCEVLMEKEKFLSAIKLSSNFTGKGSDIRIKMEGKTIEVYSLNQNLGENRYLIPVKKIKGEGFEEISFNWRYLFDGVRANPEKQIRLGLVSDSKPAIIKPQESDTLFYIVMPTKSS